MKRILYTTKFMFNALLLNMRSRQGFAWMVLIFRGLAWLSVGIRFLLTGEAENVAYKIVWWGYFIFIILMAFLAVKYENRLASPLFQTILVVADVLSISYFIYIGNNPHSEMYLLFLLPLITVAHFLERKLSVGISLVIVAWYFLPLLLITISNPNAITLSWFDRFSLPDSVEVVILVLALWLPRAIFLLASTWLYRVQRNLPPTDETYVISPSKARLILEKYLEDLHLSVPFDTASVQILYRDRLQIVACLGFENPDDIYRIEFPVDDERYPNKKVIATNKPQIEDPRNYPSFNETQYHSTNVKSWLGVPLISPSTRECFGMISIDSRRSNAFSEKDKRRVNWFAKEASRFLIEAALGPAALTVTTKRINLQNSLRKWSNLLPRKTSVWDDDLKAAQDLVLLGQDIFHVEDCSIFFLRHRYDTDMRKEKVLHLVASSTIPIEVSRRYEIKVTGRHKDGMTGHAVHRNRTVNYGASQVAKSPYRGGFTDHLQYFFSKRCKQVMIVPLRDSKGRPTGAIKVENKLGWTSDNPFLNVEQNVFEVFAAMVSLMLENIRQRNYITRQQQSVHNVRAILHPTAIKPIDELLQDTAPDTTIIATSLLNDIRNSVNYTKSVLDGILSDSVETLILENEGLISAVSHYVEILKSMPPLKDACNRITINSKNVVRDDIPFRVRVAYYNIAREAILNMSRHSRIENKSDGYGDISFSKVDNFLHMTIQDNGIGFLVNEKKEQVRCFGLRDMYTQVANISKEEDNTKISIQSEPGNGTRIHVQAKLL